MDANVLSGGGAPMPLKKKIVIVINGRGGAGKDTVCQVAARHFNVVNISAITPIKDIAAQYGWKGEKDLRSRKFLADLKRTFVDYNDLPTRYLVQEYQKFKGGEGDILFVHIREGDQIDAFRAQVDGKCVALLVRSARADAAAGQYGNAADDGVEDYAYDYTYTNDKPLEELDTDFTRFLLQLLEREGVSPQLSPT